MVEGKWGVVGMGYLRNPQWESKINISNEKQTKSK